MSSNSGRGRALARPLRAVAGAAALALLPTAQASAGAQPAVAAASASATAAVAGASACPASQGAQRLATVTVFDGPPEQRADLMPDRHRATRQGGRSDWNVAYVYAAGRRLYVQCEYGGGVAPVIIEPGPQTTACRFDTGSRMRFACTPPAR